MSSATGDLAKGLDHIVRGDLRAKRAAAPSDQARGAHQGHPRRRPGWGGQCVGIVVQIDRAGARPGSAQGQLPRFVTVADRIDQPGGKSVLARERATVDQLADSFLRQLAALGDAADELAVQRVQERFELLTVRAGQLAVRHRLQRGLVLRPPQHLEIDAEACQEVARQGDLGAEPRQAHQPDPLQLDLVESRREVVAFVAGAQLAERLGVGDGILAGGTELSHRRAQLLGSADTVRGVRQLDQEPGDAGIGGGRVQGEHDVGHAGPRAEVEGEQIRATRRLAEFAPPVRGQEDPRRQRGRAW